MRKVQESSHFGSLLTPRCCSRIAFCAKRVFSDKEINKPWHSTQIEIRHVFFIRKGYKSSVVLIIAANISDLIQQYSEQATIVYT